jgi:DNA-binding beta-propeller fold protein YncE
MRSAPLNPRAVLTLLGAVAALATLVAPAPASAAPSSRAAAPLGTLKQISGKAGCLVDRSKTARRCNSARALRGPGPFLGSNALALSPDGRNVYVASSKSDAIAVFKRKARNGKLSQRKGPGGCIAAGGRGGCATATGLEHPNSVVVSADGENVYATALESDAVLVFDRDPSTGALTQATDGSGCIANTPVAGCATGRALDGPDVVVASPDGTSVYVGAFFGNAVAAFTRDPATGALTQAAGEAGCIANTTTDGCAPGLALGAPEGMAISADGDNVYVAAATGNAVDVLDRDPATGALTQATDGTGCIVDVALTDCTTGLQLSGANAVAVSPDDADVYVTSLLSNSLTSFTRAGNGDLTQQAGTSACVIYVLAVGCSLGRAFSAPEGLAVSPDGTSVYAAAFESDAIAVLTRNTDTGAVIQRSGRAGCLTAAKKPDCRRARALDEVSSLTVSPDGRFVYAAAFASNAVAVFKRGTRTR